MLIPPSAGIIANTLFKKIALPSIYSMPDYIANNAQTLKKRRQLLKKWWPLKLIALLATVLFIFILSPAFIPLLGILMIQTIVFIYKTYYGPPEQLIFRLSEDDLRIFFITSQRMIQWMSRPEELVRVEVQIDAAGHAKSLILRKKEDHYKLDFKDHQFEPYTLDALIAALAQWQPAAAITKHLPH